MIALSESDGVGQPSLGIDRSVHRIVGLDDPETNVTSGSSDSRSLGLADMESAAVDDRLAAGGETTAAWIVRVQLDAAVPVEVALTDIADSPRTRRRGDRLLNREVGDAEVLAGIEDVLNSNLVEAGSLVDFSRETAAGLVVQTAAILDDLAHVLVPFSNGIDSRDALFGDPMACVRPQGKVFRPRPCPNPPSISGPRIDNDPR